MKARNTKTDSFFCSEDSLYLSSIPSLSLLGGAVLKDFNSLHNGAKGVFRRLYLALYNWLVPQSKLEIFYMSNYINPALDQLNPKVSMYEFYLLARLYYLSGGGVHALDSRMIKFTTTENKYIRNLMKLGFITRSSFDPASPYLISNRCIQKVYLNLTMPGITFYNKLVVTVYNEAKMDLFALTQNQNKKKTRKS